MPVAAPSITSGQRIVQSHDGETFVITDRSSILALEDDGIHAGRQEDNPALGLRGIRGGLAHPAGLEDHLRKLLTPAPADGRLLLTMVTDSGEVQQLRELCHRVAADLGIAPPSLMAEVALPAAALLAEHLGAAADFLAVDADALARYTLAADAAALGCDALHPAVLRLVARTAEGAARSGALLALLGPAAADPWALPLWLGLGVREFIVPPASMAGIADRLPSVDRSQCQRQLPALLALGSGDEVRAGIRRLWPH